MTSISIVQPEHTLLITKGRLVPGTQLGEYLDLAVEVPEGVHALRVDLTFTKIVDEFQLYAALFDTEGRFRGHTQCPGGPGPRELQFTVAGSGSSWGCIDAKIEPGSWTVRLDFDRLVIAGDYALGVIALDMTPSAREPLEERVAVHRTHKPRSPLPGWVAGELHSHSRHSDGATSPAYIVEAAIDAGMSFLAVSDHFTSSHWGDIDQLAQQPGSPALLHSIEVTSHYGHSNVHGIAQSPNTYIDGAGGFRELATEVHAQGGLLSVNHPFSGRQAWRRTDAPWDAVDLIEVANASQGANNDAAIGLWDGLLTAGHRIIAIAGTDSHDPDTEDGRLGAVTTLLREANVTALHEQRLTERTVIKVLREGAVCVSRGAAIDLVAHSGDASATMGGALELAGELTITATVDTPSDRVLFLFRNGLMWGVHPFEAGHHMLSVSDNSGSLGYYRAEFHRGDESEQFWASCNRSHESLLALSNPIWVS